MIKSFAKILTIIGLLVTLFNPVLVLAQTTSTTPKSVGNPTAADLPRYNQGVDQSIKEYLCTPSKPADGQDLQRCINRIYRFSVAFGAIILVFFVVYAGYVYISQGEQGKASAKKYIENSLVGLGLLLGSYIILYFISPSLVQFRTIQPPIFKANDLPSCEEIGFATKCIIADGPNAGQVVSDGGACALPIKLSDALGSYNSSVHNPWDDDEKTPDRHRTVRKIPNAPDPTGAVDVRMQKSGMPVFSPVSGTVELNRELALGRYISISSTGNCSSSSNCVNIAHITPSVNPGDVVVAGQQVATITPNSGGLGPVMHIELKLGGQWILGDGKGKTWENMKSAISKCSGGSGGSAPAGLVAVKGIIVDMQYASASPSSHNFMSKALYVGQNSTYAQQCYVKPEMAKKIEAAQSKLSSINPDWKIKAWDCFRPFEIQQEMYQWAQKNKPGLVADPGTKDKPLGKHPQGFAIDATLYDTKTKKDVVMPTHFDLYDSDKKDDQQRQRPGSSAYNNLPLEARKNADILNQAMKAGGLTRAPNEWWHFNY